MTAAVPTGETWPAALAEPLRRAALAAAASTHAAASGAGELHHRDLSPVAALELTFAGFGGQQLAPDEIRERVRVRFPAVPSLPQRPTLDALVADAGLGLTFDDRLRVYRATETGSATTGLESRRPTSLAVITSPVGSTGALGARLETSIGSRSFLALGVRADRLPRFVTAAQARYGATVIDLTSVLLDTLRTVSAAANMPWDLVRAADAERASSRPRRGLEELVRRSWPEVEAAVERALAAGDVDKPVLLAEASPLARYDNIALLARWTDLAAPRRRAVWLLVPQLGGNHGPLIDGRPIPLAAPSQFVALHPTALLLRAFVADDRAALDQAIALLQSAIERQAPAERQAYIKDLGRALRMRFERTGSVVDLNRAVDLGHQCVQATLTQQPQHPDLPSRHGELAASLLMRYRHFGLAHDLDGAVEHSGTAVRLTASSSDVMQPGQTAHPQRAEFLSTYAATSGERFAATGDLNDLAVSVDLHRQALGGTPTRHPLRPLHLHRYAVDLLRGFDHTGDVTEADQAVAACREAVAIVTAGHPDRGVYLRGWSVALQARSIRVTTPGERDEAEAIARQAVAAMPPGHVERAEGARPARLGSAVAARRHRSHGRTGRGHRGRPRGDRRRRHRPVRSR